MNHYEDKLANYSDKLLTEKVLIISHNSLSSTANNGKTLESLFDCFASGSIAQLYFQTEVPSSSKFNNFFRISDLDIIKSLLNFNLNFGRTIDNLPCYDPRDTYGKSSALISHLKSFSRLKSIIREILYSLPMDKSKGFTSWLDEFKPTAIFVLGGESSFLFKIALTLAIKKDIPLHIFFTDDYLLNAHKTKIKLLQRNYRKFVLASIKQAKSCFCISDKMAAEYNRSFFRDFYVLNNAVDFSRKISTNADLTQGLIKFVYAGGLTLGRDHALIDFCRVISAIASKNRSTAFELSIYSANEIKSNLISMLDNMEGVNILINGFKTASEMNQVYDSSHFLLHVESSDPLYISKTWLSISTKISECLASKRCLIAYGPSEIASMDLIVKNNIGLYLDSSLAIDENANSLSEVVFSQLKYDTFVDRGYKYATRRFSKDNLQKTLLNQL